MTYEFKKLALEALVPGSWSINDETGAYSILIDTNVTEEDIIEKTVELEYTHEVQEYQRNRASEYPNWGTQLDYIYHNGVDAWKTDIVDPVKTAYPKQEIDETELASRKAQALFDYQLAKYNKAKERLAQYQVSLGRDEITEEFVIGQNTISTEEGDTYEDITETRVVSVAIEPLPATVTEIDIDGNEIEVENLLITKDNEERAAAQAIVDATPQEVIDAYNAL